MQAHTHAERLAAGRAARKVAPRSDQSHFKPAKDRDPIGLLRAASKGRIPELLKIKRERMAVSPFGFFRGAAPLMAFDLAQAPRTSVVTQLCGDAHVRNLGAYAGLDGRLTFDINDFDETLPGPFEWDVKRLAASILLAGAEAGAKDDCARDAAALFLSRYRRMMEDFASMPTLDVGRYLVHRLRRNLALSSVLRSAERATPEHTLAQLTRPGHPHRVFRAQPPVLRPVTGREADQVLASLKLYAQSLQPERRHLLAQYRPFAVAFKVVGTGSVGLRDYCVYLEGNSPAAHLEQGPQGLKLDARSLGKSARGLAKNDPLFLQIKQAVLSAYAPYLPDALRHTHQGQRVIDGERAMQLQSDPFLGFTRIAGRDYLVRQLNDHKATVELDDLKGEGLLAYADVCGELLARGHARSGDPVALHGYLGRSERFDQAILKFAEAYAHQTEKDWDLFKRSPKKA